LTPAARAMALREAPPESEAAKSRAAASRILSRVSAAMEGNLLEHLI
jgi:hypothetical protein